MVFLQNRPAQLDWNGPAAGITNDYFLSGTFCLSMLRTSISFSSPSARLDVMLKHAGDV